MFFDILRRTSGEGEGVRRCAFTKINSSGTILLSPQHRYAQNRALSQASLRNENRGQAQQAGHAEESRQPHQPPPVRIKHWAESEKLAKNAQRHAERTQTRKQPCFVCSSLKKGQGGKAGREGVGVRATDLNIP